MFNSLDAEAVLVCRSDTAAMQSNPSKYGQEFAGPVGAFLAHPDPCGYKRKNLLIDEKLACAGDGKPLIEDGAVISVLRPLSCLS